MKPQIQSFLTAMALSALVLFCRSGAFAQSIHDTLWQTDGAVLSTARFGDTLFVGGGFKHVGPYTGCGGMLDTSTGEVLPGYYNSRLKMQISSVIPDGSGGWYVGGSNSMYQEAEHTVRHLLADNTIDPVFDPNPRLAYPSFSAASIYCLASYGENIYFGGDVATVSMQGRSKMAAVNKITGALTSWNPPTINSYVRAIAFSGSNVIIGGDFTQIGGQVRNRLAAIDINTGALTSWNPNANGAVYTILISGSTIYVGGSFTKIGDSTRNRIASFDATTGLLTAWKPSFNNYVYAITISGSSIYVGGSFTTVGTSTRQGIAQFDLATGDLDSWSPRATGVRTIAVSDSKVYIGGSFWYINDSLRDELGVIDSVTGRTLSWKPCAPRGYVVNSMAFSGPVLYVGGDFPNLGWRRENLAAINLQTGKFLDWAPNLDGSVITMSVLDSTLFIGGSFDSVDGQRRRRLASFSLKTGNVSNWIMDANNTVRAIASSGIDIFVGGEFTKINDITKPYLVSFYSTGSMKPSTVLPNASVYAIAISGGNVYIGGNFTQIGGDTRMGLAAINLAGSGLLPWNPTLTWPSGYQAVKAIAVSDTTVYVGGYFDKVGDSTRVRLAAISTNLVGRATIWNPGLSTYVSGSTTAFSYVNAVSVDGPIIYVAGNFSIVSAQKGYCVAIDAISGIPTDWRPIWGTPDVRAIYVADPWVYLGGQLSQCEPYASLCNPDRHNFLAYKRADYLYTLTTSATNGTITKNPNRPNYDLGQLVQLTTIPNTGHHFMSWSGDVPSGHEYDNPLTIIIDQNKTIASRCDIDTFYITATAIGRGTITPPGVVPVIFRHYQTFTITPNSDGINDSVFVDGYYIGKVTSHTFTSVTRNHTITAYFKTMKDTIRASAVNGTINPTGTVPVDQGSDQAFTWSPNTNYHFSDLLVDGVHKDSTTSYTFKNIIGNHTIQAIFAINTHIILASVVGNGTIIPSGAVSVNHGSNQSFSITPLTGYHVDSVKVDGFNIGAVTSYQFTNVSTTHTITAYFSINKYTITTSVVGNGSITPSGSIIVSHGNNQAFSIASIENHHVDSVKVDGTNLGVLSSYEFATVSSNHTITAYFSINEYTLHIAIVGNGTVNKDPEQLTYTHGSTVQLSSTPAYHYRFTGWSGDISPGQEMINPLTVTMNSDKNFTATFISYYCDVTSPNGGENLYCGSIWPITWSCANVANIKIEYSTDNGSSWIEIIASTPASSGSHNWTVPTGMSTGEALVRITDVLNASMYDESDDVFTIGMSWLPQTVGTDKSLTDVCFINTTTGWAVGNNGVILYTSNGGTNWIERMNGAPSLRLAGVSFVNANYGWVACENGKILRTTNGGLNWSVQTTTTSNHLNDIYFIDETLGWVVGNGGVVLSTTNGGLDWSRQTSPISEHLNGISFIDEDLGWVIGANGTIMHTINGGNLWSLQSGGTTDQLNDICFIDEEYGWIVGNNGTIISTTNGGSTWTIEYSGTTRHLNGVCFISDDFGWVVGNNGTILRYGGGALRNAVQTQESLSGWEGVPSGTTRDLSAVFFIGGTIGTILGDSGTVLNYNPSTTDSSYLPLSISATQSWNMLSIPMVIADFKATVAFRGCNSDIFTYNPLTGYESKNVLNNGAGYWARFPNSKFINICGVQINLDTFDVIEGWNMIGSIGMLIPVATIISEPGGLITSNFFGYDGSYIVVDNIMPGKGYWVKASEAGKLILSSGSILSASARIKIQPTSGLPPPPPDEGHVLNETIPQEYKLEQAYPNPFNPTTKIKYNLPKDSRVTLKILNLLGQEVVTLVDEIQNAGFKSIEWNVLQIGMPSGVYFYRLSAIADGNSFTGVKKVLLLK